MTQRNRKWKTAVVITTVVLMAGCSGGGAGEEASSGGGAQPSEATAAPAEVGAAPEAQPEPAQAPDLATTPSPEGSPAAAVPSQDNAVPAKRAGAAEGTNTGGGGGQAAKRTANAATAAPAPTAAPAAGGPASAAGPASGTAAPAAPAAPASDKANYASDVGVTAETIRLGTINMTSATRSLGPAIAGPQEHALDAAVKYINRTGGVAGRKLELMTCDDGGDIARGRTCYEKLKTKVFAFLPSITWITDVIHDQLAKDNIPWMSWGWFKSEYQDPWMFPCHANGMREAKAASTWAAQVKKPKTAGILYLNVSEDIAARDIIKKELEARGVKVVAEIAQEWDSPDESQHVLAMRAADPDIVMSFTWPASLAKFMHDASAQKWAPPLGFVGNHISGDPGYGALFGDYIKDKMFGITSWGMETSPDTNNPEGFTDEQKLLRDELLRTYGKEFQGLKWRYSGQHHIPQSGWVCTRVLAKAAAELGADLTREGLKEVLESRGWDSGLGVTLHWPKGNHEGTPYSFNREFIYQWVSHPDGGWDNKRILPDPVYDCAGGNIPAGARTICNSN